MNWKETSIKMGKPFQTVWSLILLLHELYELTQLFRHGRLITNLLCLLQRDLLCSLPDTGSSKRIAMMLVTMFVWKLVSTDQHYIKHSLIFNRDEGYYMGVCC